MDVCFKSVFSIFFCTCYILVYLNSRILGILECNLTLPLTELLLALMLQIRLWFAKQPVCSYSVPFPFENLLLHAASNTTSRSVLICLPEWAIALELLVITIFKSPINPITNPNAFYNHSNHVTIYKKLLLLQKINHDVSIDLHV
jgi:hypothetical protein